MGIKVNSDHPEALFSIKRRSQEHYLSVSVSSQNSNSFNGINEKRSSIVMSWCELPSARALASRFIRLVAGSVLAAYISLTGDSDVELVPNQEGKAS